MQEKPAQSANSTMSIVEKMARAIAEKLTDAPWECVCSANLGADCDCGDAMTEDSVDRYDESLTRNMCRITARAALTATGLTEAQLEGLANGTMVAVDAASLAEVARGYQGISIAHAHVLQVVQRAMLAAKEG